VKIAIVHDFLNQYGGAERTVEALHEAFPDAPIFTTFFCPEDLPPVFARMDVRTSFMQRMPGLRKHFKKYLLLYPLAVRSWDLSGYDVILSSSSAFAKGGRVPPGALHVCYCYTPMRFAWDPAGYLSRERMSWMLRAALAPALALLRWWDLRTSAGVHHFIAISTHIRDRIRRVYGRDAEVIYPPVDVDAVPFAPRQGDYLLVVSRLNAYKRIDLAVDACTRLGLPLVVAGDGPSREVLQGSAGPSVRFVGRVSDAERGRLLAECRAFIFPGEEDFGIAPVEAMAAGKPVVAFGAGGALETVVDGVTGLFFREPTVSSLSDALRRLEDVRFDPATLRTRAATFSKEIFQRRIRSAVSSLFAARR
jgi:glycosyltransferase involved in cell wall biosynthesis